MGTDTVLLSAAMTFSITYTVTIMVKAGQNIRITATNSGEKPPNEHN